MIVWTNEKSIYGDSMWIGRLGSIGIFSFTPMEHGEKFRLRCHLPQLLDVNFISCLEEAKVEADALFIKWLNATGLVVDEVKNYEN